MVPFGNCRNTGIAGMNINVTFKIIAAEQRKQRKRRRHTRKLQITGIKNRKKNRPRNMGPVNHKKNHPIDMGPVVQVVEPDSNKQTKGIPNKGRKKGMWMLCIVL
jgi:hypothetical protein